MIGLVVDNSLGTSRGLARSWFVVVGLGVAGLGSVVVPVWVNGDDSGWFSCGSLAFKSAERARGCELIGAYSDRLVIAYVLLGLAAIVAASRVRQVPDRRGRLRAGSAMMVLGLFGFAASAAAWSAHDTRPPPYRFEAIEVTFEPNMIDEPGLHQITVIGRDWNAPTPVIVTTCAAFPARCDMANAIEIEPVDGHFEVTLPVSVPTGARATIAAFDRDIEYYATLAVGPGLSSKSVPVEAPSRPDD